MDPASYYGQFYRSTVDSNGRISLFNPAVTANKYAGGASIPVQTSQSPQEVSLSKTPVILQFVSFSLVFGIMEKMGFGGIWN